jgi:hypothetical protein
VRVSERGRVPLPSAYICRDPETFTHEIGISGWTCIIFRRAFLSITMAFAWQLSTPCLYGLRVAACRAFQPMNVAFLGRLPWFWLRCKDEVLACSLQLAARGLHLDPHRLCPATYNNCMSCMFVLGQPRPRGAAQAAPNP